MLPRGEPQPRWPQGNKMIQSTIAARALLLGMLAFAPMLAHAEEWRWCVAGDAMDSGPPNGPFRVAFPFRADLMPGYQTNFEEHMRAAMAPIQGEFTVVCSPAFPDRQSASEHFGDWAVSLEGLIPLADADWTPTTAANASNAGPEATSSANKPADAPAQSSANAREEKVDSAPKPAADTASTAQKEREAAEQRRQEWEKAQLAAQQGSKPLRFVLWVGLRPQVGDTSNPSCYSNVITRPGPPGWTGEPNLAHGVAEKAIAIIDSTKDAFLAKCRAVSGREIDGTVGHDRNQSASDEASVDKVRARAGQDVTVQVD